MGNIKGWYDDYCRGRMVANSNRARIQTLSNETYLGTYYDKVKRKESWRVYQRKRKENIE